MRHWHELFCACVAYHSPRTFPFRTFRTDRPMEISSSPLACVFRLVPRFPAIADQLAQNAGVNLEIPIGDGEQRTANFFVQAGQRMEWNHRRTMVFGMVGHVPVQEMQPARRARGAGVIEEIAGFRAA